MKKFAIYTTKKFDKERAKLSKDEQNRIHKIFLQLRDNPYVGDQLRYKNLREKRLKEKRVYYLVYNDLQSVLVVAISGKKTQQETINHIAQYFEEYRFYLKKLLENN